MDDDQLQLDRHIIEFFQEAKAVALTPVESEQARCALETFLMEHSVSLAPAMRLQEYMTHGRESSQFEDHFLGDKEKRQLRKSLVSFMRQNPRYVPKEIVEEAVQSFSLFRMFQIAMPRLALGLMLFVGLGASMSYASQSTVPGDFLYSFKVAVYEPIVSKLAISDKSRAEWEAQRVQNRLVEAKRLASESRLTKENAAELRVQFNNHLNAAQKNIATLNAKGDADVALSIQTGLEMYLDSHSSAVRVIALDEDSEASVAASAKQPGSNALDRSSSSKRNSLVEKVQTILSLPAAVPSSSSSSVSSADAGSSSSKSKENGASSRKNDPSSSSKKNETQSSAQSSVTTFSISSAPVVEAVSSSSLVSDLFDDIMEAASSAPTIPDLLPKL